MNVSACLSLMNMSWTRGKPSGWAAFNLKQQQKQGLELEINKDPFPPMTSTLTTLNTCENFAKDNVHSVRSFSSVLMPSLDFPTWTENKDCKNRAQGGSSSRKHNNKVVEENNHNLAFKKLKETYCWADDCLIEDIVAFTDNDIEKASAFLKGMVSTNSSEESKQMKIAELSLSSDDFSCDGNKDTSASLGKMAILTVVNSTLENGLEDSKKEFSDLYTSGSGRRELSDDASDMKFIMGHLRSIPVEPEWEEDDVYLSHRKEALRMMRSASQHSRAATNAFMRGDHSSSQQHSLKAREEWLAAEKLNAKAAKEILSIRNSKNDMWKLDLHGLHAAEAVQALQEHLRKIENHVIVNRSLSPVRVMEKNGTARTSSYRSFNYMDMENSDTQWAAFRQRPTSLQVITGIGNHSRGQAALPTAVKNFLNENGYRFDEARPGVTIVRPKFRHR